MKKIIYIFTLFFSLSAFSQTLYSVLEKRKITLGESNIYKIKIENLEGAPVEIAPKNELLPFHFEEIKDSVNLQGDLYERIIEFAIFEEGTFTIPAFDVKVGGKLLKTIPYEVEVISKVQQGDQIHDIMQNKSLKMSIADYWELYKWYVLGGGAVLALVFLLWQFYKYGKKKSSSPVVATNQTLKLLEALKKKKYIEKGNFRAFYVELIDLTRQFITKQYQIPADVLLTDDLVEMMKQNQTISVENEALIEEVFQRGDLVKFAKTFPDQVTMEQDFENIRAFVKRSAKDLEFENLRKEV